MVSSELYDKNYYQTLRDEYLADTAWKRNRIANVMQLIEGLGVDGTRALDIACGIGTFTVELHRNKVFTIGIDSATNAITASSLLFRETNPEPGNFVASDALTLPFAENVFDLVMCADFIEHITSEEYSKLVVESWRVLKPGGHICVYTPNRWHFLEFMMRYNVILKRDQSHIDIKTMEKTLAPLRLSGLEVIKAYYRPTHIKILKTIESALMHIPAAGRFFRRRICVLARKPQ